MPAWSRIEIDQGKRMTYQLTSLGIGLALAATILILVRRAHLHGPNALWWLALAGGIILFGTWPRLIDLIAPYLGVSYPPIVAVLLGFSLLLIKMMSMDLQRSRQEQRLRRLAQRLAMLEAHLEASLDSSSATGPRLQNQDDPRDEGHDQDLQTAEHGTSGTSCG